MDALKAKFEPKPLVILERFVFNKRQQKSKETVADYVAVLRKLFIHCMFGDFLDDVLRDTFVCGLRSEGMQKKLLIEAELTFQRAIEIAQSMESAATKAKELQSHSQHKVKVKLCTFCNVSNTTTVVVTGVGSITTLLISVCSGTRKVRVVQEESGEDSDPLNELNHVEGRSNSPYTVTVDLDGHPQSLEIDTGACVTIILEDTFKGLLPQKRLTQSKMRLSTNSGERLQAKGECEVTVEYQGQKKTLPLVVVEGRGPNLFGRNWLSEI